MKYPPGFEEHSYGYASDGIVSFNGTFNRKEQWNEGDVITCGVRFHNIVSFFGLFQMVDVEVYFRKNDKEIKTISVCQTNGRFYPTIFMRPTPESAI